MQPGRLNHCQLKLKLSYEVENLSLEMVCTVTFSCQHFALSATLSLQGLCNRPHLCHVHGLLPGQRAQKPSL